MNTTIKLSVATALAFGAVAAHASITVPSSGSSDAILFAEVLNSSGTVVASYAGDTGVSLSTLAAGLSGTQVVLGGTANLAALFAADVGTDTLEWAVQGGQYSGAASTINFGPNGNAKFITTTAGNATTALSGDTTNSLTHWSGLTNDVGTINTNINSPATSIEGASAASAGVWDVVAANAGTAVTENWYKNGPSTANLLGGTENLYYVTGNGGGSTTKVSFTNIGTASLSAAGLTLTGTSSPPPVPLPPAVWLLGSGLLGLAGVARRKSKV